MPCAPTRSAFCSPCCSSESANRFAVEQHVRAPIVDSIPRNLVVLGRIELPTFPLSGERSTTELQDIKLLKIVVDVDDFADLVCVDQLFNHHIEVVVTQLMNRIKSSLRRQEGSLLVNGHKIELLVRIPLDITILEDHIKHGSSTICNKPLS